VEHLPADWNARLLLAVHPIGHNGAPYESQMDSDLMGPAGLRVHFQQGVIPK
jgi:hypothetical protein